MSGDRKEATLLEAGAAIVPPGGGGAVSALCPGAPWLLRSGGPQPGWSLGPALSEPLPADFLPSQPQLPHRNLRAGDTRADPARDSCRVSATRLRLPLGRFTSPSAPHELRARPAPRGSEARPRPPLGLRAAELPLGRRPLLPQPPSCVCGCWPDFSLSLTRTGWTPVKSHSKLCCHWFN